MFHSLLFLASPHLSGTFIVRLLIAAAREEFTRSRVSPGGARASKKQRQLRRRLQLFHGEA